MRSSLKLIAGCLPPPFHLAWRAQVECLAKCHGLYLSFRCFLSPATAVLSLQRSLSDLSVQLCLMAKPGPFKTPYVASVFLHTFCLKWLYWGDLQKACTYLKCTTWFLCMYVYAPETVTTIKSERSHHPQKFPSAHLQFLLPVTDCHDHSSDNHRSSFRHYRLVCIL